MTILYKICLYPERLLKHGARPGCNSMSEMVFGCLNSLLQQMRVHDNIVFFCDGSDSISKIEALCRHYKVHYSIITFNYHDAAKIHNSCIQYVNHYPVDQVYVCEDDYLHFDNCLNKIEEFLTQHPMWFCHPIDYPNLYEADPAFNYQSTIIVTKSHHWRSIKTTTYTLAFTKELYKSQQHVFNAIVGDVWYEHGINLLYILNQCYSPIPSLTSHITTGCLPYTIDSINHMTNHINQVNSILST